MRICKLTGEPLGFYCSIAPMVAAAGIGAAGQLLGGLLGSSGASSARRLQKEMFYQGIVTQDRWRTEDKAWEEMMSNSAMQRHVKDLEAAGLNPMLGYAGSASTPSAGGGSVPQFHAENVDAPLAQGVANAFSAAQAAMLNEAQVENVQSVTKVNEAQARKVVAEALLEEAKVPTSAANADTQQRILDRQFEILGQELKAKLTQNQISLLDWDIRDIDAKAQEELKPLLVEYQQLINSAERFGLSEREATSKFFETVPWAKWIQLVRMVMPSISIGGRR